MIRWMWWVVPLVLVAAMAAGFVLLVQPPTAQATPPIAQSDGAA